MRSKSLNPKYVPKHLTRKDRIKQIKMIDKSKKMYRRFSKSPYSPSLHSGEFSIAYRSENVRRFSNYTRKFLSSYKYRPSKHVANARKIYGIENITPNKELAKKTGCKLSALKQIVRKGEGAYYSSGSRPNQTPQSWGLARLASAITSGKSSLVDFHIIDKGCDHKKKAYLLARKTMKKHK
jgi:hypothetical protein